MEPNAVTLFDVEETLLALLDSAEMVTPEQEAEYQSDLAATLQTVVAKRDRVAGFIRHCEAMVAACTAEEERLAGRRLVFQRAADRVREYVHGAMTQMQLKELAGKLATFKICKNPDSVVITDEAAVPAEFKTLSVSINAEEFEILVELLAREGLDKPLLKAIKKTQMTISKSEIKKALATREVPGADLKIDSERLEVR